ncbi:AraC family transcriptional regulator [Pseudomonadota bacterium]
MRTDTNIPNVTVPLGEILYQRRLTDSFYCRSELTAPWGVDQPTFDDCMMFHIVIAGHCWLEVKDEESYLWRQGSLVRVPHGTGHCVRSHPDEEIVITHLARILIIQVIRSRIDSAPGAEQEWLAALRGIQVGKVLLAIHRALYKPSWGICHALSPQRCMQHAQLQETSDSLTQLAGCLGYQLEAAFCRAFKQAIGVSPGSVRNRATQISSASQVYTMHD